MLPDSPNKFGLAGWTGFGMIKQTKINKNKFNYLILSRGENET